MNRRPRRCPTWWFGFLLGPGYPGRSVAQYPYLKIGMCLMDDDLRLLLKEIIKKLASIESNTGDISYVQSGVKDVVSEIKKLRDDLQEK
jgi:hypothetical protein